MMPNNEMVQRAQMRAMSSAIEVEKLQRRLNNANRTVRWLWRTFVVAVVMQAIATMTIWILLGVLAMRMGAGN
jgi:type IV secretory pathway component VirB8